MEIKKYLVRFNLISSSKDKEEKQIYLIVTIEGMKVYYYSGHRIKPENFVIDKKESIYQVKKNSFNKSGEPASTINSRLRELEKASLIVFQQNFKGRDIEFSKDLFKKFLQIQLNEYEEVQDSSTIGFGLFEYYEKYKNEAKVSDGRRRHYAADMNRLREYEQTKKRSITFDNLDIIDYNKYISKGRASNTVVTIMKRLKGFFSYCKMESIVKENPFDRINFATKIGVEIYNEPVCMTRNELKQLYETRMPNELTNLVKDMFCLQAALGCRVSDFVRLKTDNIDNDLLTYFPSKTKEYANKVIVPLSERAKTIILKYKNKTKNGLLMPFLHPNEYNEQLKPVFRIAKLTRKVIQYNRDKGIEEISELCELATSHLARRTFVDILCQAGEPIHVVASSLVIPKTQKLLIDTGDARNNCKRWPSIDRWTNKCEFFTVL